MSNRQSPQCAVTPHALNLFFIFYALHYSSNIRTSHHLHTHTETQTLSPEASHFLFPHSWWKNRKIYLLTVCSKCSNIPKKATQLFFPDSSYYIKYKATCSVSALQCSIQYLHKTAEDLSPPTTRPSCWIPEKGHWFFPLHSSWTEV